MNGIYIIVALRSRESHEGYITCMTISQDQYFMATSKV